MALKIAEMIGHRNAPGNTPKPNAATIARQRTPQQGVAVIQRSAPAPAPVATPVQRDTVSTQGSPAGSGGLFDICTNADLISLSFQGVDQFINWLGFNMTNELTVKRGFIAWERPEYSSGSATAGWLSDPCGDANGVDFAICDFTLTGFARLRRHGPTRDITLNNTVKCFTEPRKRIDGTPITSVDEYDMRLAMEAILGDLRKMLVNGNKQTSGQFDGLQRTIKTGYTNADGNACELMDSIVVNWNSNGAAGGSGATINGDTVANTVKLVDMLLYIHRAIKTRIMAAPALAAQTRRTGDQVIMLPNNLITCLLDAYTCWSVCPGAQYNETALNSYEARVFRTTLNGGMFGYGQITLDGDTIPLVGYDWGTMTGGKVKVSSITRSSTTATATTAQAHGLTTGDSVTISGATGTEYNGTFTVTVTDATHFTYTVSGTPTSPDPSTAIWVTIPIKNDIYYLTGHVGDMELLTLEVLDMSTAPDVAGLPQFSILDSGRYLTWTNNDNTCITRNIELRPRLVNWAPWAQARIQNVTCTLAGPAFSMDPTSQAFKEKTFTSA